MVTFRFEFDKPDRKYKPGDTVHCKITENITSKFSACSLSIRFKGNAHTQWEKTRNHKTKKFKGDEEYFRHYEYIFGSRDSLMGHEVLAGTNVYNVSFTLPQRLPSSFVGWFGSVVYDVKAKYDVSWGFDKECHASFFVTSTLDLNEFPHLREPVKAVEKTTFGCCCFVSEPMKIITILPKSGFVIGHTIPVTIQVDNGSDVRLQFVHIRLKEQITYITTSPRRDTKTQTNIIKEGFLETAVEPFQNKVFETAFFLDPAFDWKICNGCEIIDAIYYLKLEAMTSGCYKNFEIKTVGITIGTIPFDELPPIPTAPDEGPVIMEQPLPSYNEAMRSLTPIDGETGDTGLQVTPSGSPFASSERFFFDNNMPSAPTEYHPTAPPQYSDIN